MNNEITILNNLDIKNIPRIPEHNKIIPARVIDVHDGDTVTVVFLLGGVTPFRINIRLLGIDAPELRGELEIEKIAAKKVRDVVSDLISDKIIFLKIKDWDKFEEEC